MFRATCLLAIATVMVAAAPVLADAGTQEDALKQLREEFDRMRAEYEQRIAKLEAHVQALESSPATSGATHDELADLRAAAQQAAGPAPQTAPEPTGPAVGHERSLNRLNPEISFTGDVLALREDSTGDFEPREFELDLQAALDPFSYTKLTLAYGEDGVEVEEGYIGYHGLGGSLSVRAGKMRQTFGALNRFHLHALPQFDYPLVVQNYFGEEGLAQTGVSLDWLVPHPWASANELTLQVTDGSAEPFGGGSFDRLAALAHVKNYWDLSPASYFEWGLSGISGRPAEGRDTRVVGTDLTWHWQPPGRAKYRELTWRTELLRSERDDDLGLRQRAWGGYTYVEGLVRRNLYAGLRFDRYQDALDPDSRFRAWEPYVSWWQSEYVRLRLSYQERTDELLDTTDHDVRIQATWAAGPHKHESY